MNINPDTVIRERAEPEEQEFNIRQFFILYVARYWYLYVISISIALAGAYYYNWYVTPVYEASCSVLVKEAKVGGGASTDLFNQIEDYATERNIQNEIEVLRSRTLISKTLQRLDFSIAYFLKGNVRTQELYKSSPFKITIDSLKLAAYSTPVNIHVLDDSKYEISLHSNIDETDFSEVHRFGEKVSSPIGTFEIMKQDRFNNSHFSNQAYEKRNFIARFNSPEELISHYTNLLKVDLITRQSSILKLTMEDPVREKAVDFLNMLIEESLRNNVEQKNQIAENSLAFIDAQLSLIAKDLNEIEGSFEKLRTDKGITDLGMQASSYLNSAKEYDSRIAETDLKISFLNYLENYVKGDKNLKDISPASLGIDDPLLQKLILQLNELENKREGFGVDAKAENPLIKQLNAQIENTKSDLLENIKSIGAGLMTAQSEARLHLNKVEGKIRLLPGTEREVLSIKRQNDIKAGILTYLMQKRAETAIILASATSDNRLVDNARASFIPLRPVKEQTYGIALFIAIIIPVGFVYFKFALNDKVQNKSYLESKTIIPLLGIVGLSADTEQTNIRNNPKSHIAEAFRSIRTNLRFFSDVHAKSQVYLVTSSVGSEGKSFCAVNLASIIALSGKKTIMLGFDLRKPKSPEQFSVSNDTGISTYLIGSASEKEIIQSSGAGNLDFILSGPKPPNPAELIMSERMNTLMEFLKANYDYIILDTPPLGLITDAMILTKYADVTIYVVRQNVTRNAHLQAIDRIYREGKIKNLCIIFNAVKNDSVSYGYGYGNSYGNYEEDIYPKTKSIFARMLKDS